MIPGAQEIIYRIYGAWRLARFDASGVQYFDESPAAALRSFFAAVLVVPAYFVIDLLVPNEAVEKDVTLFTILAELLVYSLSWTVFPLVAYYICRAIDREQAFFRFLCANNWAKVISYHLALAMFVFVAGGVLPEGPAAILALFTVAYLLGYQWFVIRVCLNVSGVGAVGFMAVQLFIDFVIIGFVAVIFT